VTREAVILTLPSRHFAREVGQIRRRGYEQQQEDISSSSASAAPERLPAPLPRGPSCLAPEH
jgi:hypothetical protein